MTPRPPSPFPPNREIREGDVPNGMDAWPDLGRMLRTTAQRLRRVLCRHCAPGHWRRGSALQIIYHQHPKVALKCPWCGWETAGFTLEPRTKAPA